MRKQSKSRQKLKKALAAAKNANEPAKNDNGGLLSEKITLNAEQKAAVSFMGDEKSILVIAGAGCGKTITIIARAVHLVRSGTDSSRVLIMTFTRRAAKEVKNRLKSEIGPIAKKMNAGTFHSFCFRVMQDIPKSFEIEGLSIIDADDQKSFMTLVRRQLLKHKPKSFKNEIPNVKELIDYLSYSRNTCQDVKVYLSENTEMKKNHIQTCFRIFKSYQKRKKSRGYLDFDDLLEIFGNILERKPLLRKALAEQFDEVLVDEMQDTNPLQLKILRQFSSEGVRLFCVGDPAQSIYRFRGAEFEHVYEFEKIFPNSTTLQLSINYRSYQEILDFSNWLLKRSPLEYKNNLSADRGESGCRPELVNFDSVFDEAGWIADKIIERRNAGLPYRDNMVLVRTSYDAKPIETEFLRSKIPYRFIGGTSLTKSAHVRDVLSLLRIVRNPKDDLAWMRYLTLWPRIGDKTAEKIIDSFYEKSEESPIEVLLERLGDDHNAFISLKEAIDRKSLLKDCVSSAIENLTPILKERYERWKQRSQDLKLLATVSKRYKSMNEFIDTFTLEPMTSTEIEKLEVDDAVTLITVHSAKGTEAPVCFVAGAKQGTYPHLRSYGDIQSEEEERRILYVALTRAKNELFVTRSTDSRSSFYVQNKPTKGEAYFLADVPKELVQIKNVGLSPATKHAFGLRDIY